MNSVVLKNVRPFDGEGFAEEQTVNIVEGVWAPSAPEGTPEFDAKGALAIPAPFGLGLDFQAPLRDDVYTFEAGFEAMRRGGFYGGLYESAANPIDDSEKLCAMLERVKKEPLDIVLLGAFSVGFGSEMLSEMLDINEGVAGFGDGNASFPSVRFLRLAMEYGSMTGKRFFFMPMDRSLRKSGVVNEGGPSDTLGMKGIPFIAETIAAFTILELSAFLKVPVHFKQVTSAATLGLVSRARERGLDVTCDVDIHHLLFDDSALLELNSAYHLCPPLRSESDKLALIGGLKSGLVNAVSFNHTPVLRQDTEVNFEDSVPGAVSLEIGVPALWTFLEAELGAKKAVELLSYAPAKIAGVRKAELAPGKRADFLVLDTHREHLVTAKDFAGQVCNSPFLGKKLPATILGSFVGSSWRQNA